MPGFSLVQNPSSGPGTGWKGDEREGFNMISCPFGSSAGRATSLADSERDQNRAAQRSTSMIWAAKKTSTLERGYCGVPPSCPNSLATPIQRVPQTTEILLPRKGSEGTNQIKKEKERGPQVFFPDLCSKKKKTEKKKKKKKLKEKTERKKWRKKRKKKEIRMTFFQIFAQTGQISPLSWRERKTFPGKVDCRPLFAFPGKRDSLSP